MAKAFLSIIGVIAIGGLVAGRALAGHGEPLKAKKLQFDLVNSFFRCDVPNTSM